MKSNFSRLQCMGVIVVLQTAITAFCADSSNAVFVVTNTARTNLSSQPSITRTAPGLVESNGMYSIDIQMEPPEEVLPATTSPMPLDMKQVLAIYAELTGAELRVAESVRQFPGLIQFPKQHPPMTRAQVCELFETTLREQAGVEVIHPDKKHAILRFRKGNATKPDGRDGAMPQDAQSGLSSQQMHRTPR